MSKAYIYRRDRISGSSIVMTSFLFFFLWSITSALYTDGSDILPFSRLRNATMAVVIDKGFFSGKDEDYRKARTIILDSIHEIVKKEIRVGYIDIRALQDTNVDFREDYTVLLSIATCNKTWHLHESARQSGVIHLAITDRSCPRISIFEGISIPLINPGEELPQMFLDLRTANALSWKNVVILHDDSFEKEKINNIVQAVTSDISNMNIASRSIFSFKRFASEWVRRQHIKDILNSFHIQQLGNCFLVIVTVDTITDVMEVAKSLKMVHPGSQWLYVLTDAGNRNSTNVTYLADLLPEGGNVALIYNITTSDGTCNIDLLYYVNDFVRYFGSAVKNSSQINNELYENITNTEHEMFRLTKSQINSHILKSINTKFSEKSNLSNKKYGNCLFWKISSAITWGNYFFYGRKGANLIETSTWRPRQGINLSDVIFPHIAYGFRGISLPIVTFHNPPWQMVNVMKNGEVSYGGLVFDVLKYLGKKLNFTYVVFVPKIANNTKALRGSTRALKVGERPHGTLTSTTRKLPEEVLKLVRTKKVLLAACAYTVSDFEKSAINFTIPIFVQTYSFLTSRPTQLSRALLFTSPFTKETWACLAAAIIIMGPILYLVHKYSPSSTKMSGLNSSWQCVWYVYGALLQQGGMYLPKSDSARILVGTWWLIVTVLVATYSGSLIAFLTFPKIDDPILTVDNLLAHKDKLTWGFPNGSFLEEYLQSSENEQYRLLLSRSERHNDTEETDIIRRVKDGKHVFIDWRSSLRFLMRKDLLSSGICHFSLSTEEFMDEPIAMIVPNNSPYLPIINSELYRMYESGLINKWISEKMPTRDKCWVGANSNEIVDKRKVNVADMQGIFFVLFMGIVLAIIFLCWEFYWHRRKVSKQRKFIQPFVF
ncbi:ionotropic receptor 93a-like isoform X2 [Vespa velutina]|uniref:ionotropic receptor 93a-like isoform X2 n=1 Tax=Vespa velutina TaxID=202808 RepID=UPI001FB3F654|nr:ionotropic receptor 93a-like isoform X2 [Vespa velutina]